MSLRLSWFSTSAAVALALALPFRCAAAGGPLTFSHNQSYPFTGSSLVAADVNEDLFPDLIGVDGANVVIALNDGGQGFLPQISVSMGEAALSLIRTTDLNGDGLADLIALNQASTLLVRIGQPGMVFAPVTAFPVPIDTRWAPRLVLGDINGDQRPDVVINDDQHLSVVVLLNEGSGNFGAPTSFPIGRLVESPVIGDFTGDGLADLVAARYQPDRSLVLLAGDGSGNFAPPVAQPVGSHFHYSLAASDLDFDGDLDLVAAGDDQAAVYENLGSGNFAPPRLLELGPNAPLLGGWRGIAIDDVDEDGFPDIVMVDLAGQGFANVNQYISLFLNHGRLDFSHGRNYRVGSGPQSLALVDLDRDGHLDAVTTCTTEGEHYCFDFNSGPEFACVLRGLGANGFDGLVEVYDPVWMPVRPGGGAPPDLYGSLQGQMYRARNDGNGNFDDAKVIGHGDPRAAVDFDGDGDDDLAVVSGDSLWLQIQLPHSRLSPRLGLRTGVEGFDFADVNGDGHLDLLTLDADRRIDFSLGHGAAGFGRPNSTGVGVADTVQGRWSWAARDVNGDGFADLLIADVGPTEYDYDPNVSGYRQTMWLHVFLGTSAGRFGPPIHSSETWFGNIYRSAGGGSLRFGDWNGDGRIDLVCGVEACRSDLRCWLPVFAGSGDGRFVASAPVETGSSCDVALADVNGDGLDDLVDTVAPVGCTITAYVMLSRGASGFSSHADGDYRMGELPKSLWLADVNGDGRLDLLTRSDKLDYPVRMGSYSIRLNQTAAPPSARRTFPAESAPGIDAALPGKGPDGEAPARTGAAGERALGTGGVAGPEAILMLDGARPNPAQRRPTIQLTVPRVVSANLTVLDVAGRVIRRERLESLAPGSHQIAWRGPTLVPGFYLIRLDVEGQRLQKSFVILK